MTIPSPGPADRARDAEAGRQAPAAGPAPDAARSPVALPGAGADGTGHAPHSESKGKAARRGRGSSAAAQQSGGAAGAKPWKSTDDWGVFRTVVVAVGVLIAGIGVYYLVTGTAGVAQTSGGAVNASLESQFRFFSAMMVGVGAAFVAIAVKFQWANMLWLVCLMVFLGGIGRVLSWAFSGTPHFTLIILMILELAFPPALLVWHRFILKTSELRREFHHGSASTDGSAGNGA
ncbi:DUF4345 domain-containing protein [Arthrobacter luteolus]|uniref:DUF4345 domain-containing protein n=1 Tax=Arthrobacter luteolus TaxID=98672 RepID=UPI00082D76AB|nr:DUF4345 domain-containing protein [Arthrobacter luteolus]